MCKQGETILWTPNMVICVNDRLYSSLCTHIHWRECTDWRKETSGLGRKSRPSQYPLPYLSYFKLFQISLKQYRYPVWTNIARTAQIISWYFILTTVASIIFSNFKFSMRTIHVCASSKEYLGQIRQFSFPNSVFNCWVFLIF